MLEMFLCSIVVAVILFGVYFGFCAKKIRGINKEIERILNSQDIISDLGNSKLLSAAWKNFERTLIKLPDKTYSTTDAAEFFNQQSLTRGMNMTFWQSYGGIFTGLGILGTFLGLTVGLSRVVIPKDNDVEVLKTSIAQLLSGVETAFVTSLVGIGAALIYSGVHHYLLVKLQKNIQTLADKLDETFPRRSVEDWLAESHIESQSQTTTLKSINDTAANTYAESQSQTTVLKNIGEDVAQAIYDGLDERMNAAVETLCNKLEGKLLPQVDRICAAIDNLGKGGSEALGDIFTKGVGSQMDRFSAALDKFSDKAETIMTNAQEVSRIMNEQLLNTLKTLDETLKQQAKASAAERDEASKQFLATLKSLTDTLNEVAEKIKTQQEDSGKGFAELLKATLDNFNATMAQILAGAQSKSDGMNQKFLDTLESLTTTLNDLAEKIKTQQQETADGFAQMLTASLNNFNEVMKKILAKAQSDADKNNDTNQKASEQFLLTLAGLGKTLQDVVDKFKQQQTGTLGNFETLINNLIANLEKFTNKQQEFLRNAANANSVRISEAVNAFREIVDNHNATIKKTFGEVQKLLNETETYLDLINDASTSLKQAANPVKESTLQLSRNLTETSAQMKTLATANQTTRDNLASLSTQLDTFVKNFNGIADELERSTKIIHDSLDNYNIKTSKELSDALTKFGSTMAEALGGLDEAVSDFSDAVVYVKQKRR